MPLLTVKNQDDGMRLDKFVSQNIKTLSRSKIQLLIKKRLVLVNNSISKSSYTVSLDDVIKYKPLKAEEIHGLLQEKLDLKILYEEKNFFVIDKPFGIVVHPSETGGNTNTIVNAVLNRIDKKYLRESTDLRPGIVHRLDKDTSGVLIIAKNKETHDYFVEQFKERTIKKYYTALVYGILEHKEGIIDSPIGRDLTDRKKMSISSLNDGKTAISQYKVIKEFRLDNRTAVSLLQIEIKTGRTHQIRVHMKAINHPVICDRVYGIRSFNEKIVSMIGLKRQFLHAYKLSFKSPNSHKTVIVESKLPVELELAVDKLKNICD